MNSYEWLLFDADNTLFDFNAAEDYALTKTLLHFGANADGETKACYSAVNDALWKAFERGEIPQEAIMARRFAQFMELQGLSGDSESWNRYYVQSLSGCSVLLPGAEALCRRAAQKYTLVLITNGVPFVQRSRLQRSPIARYFGDRVFISGEMGCRKPEKEFFDRVLEAIGARKQRSKVLVIGDSLSSDIRGAFNARLDSVWLKWPSAKAGPIQPTYEVENLAQLAAFLNAHRMVPIRP